ncbi:hypothetical protein CIPAW_08G120600 [Carya illinoinensis]|uniref:Uncharacterized protein n=1 Tax=Carya illinoinensis TaxID=32201 RepID=A0A8T1PM95_CARIL|nr:hypothetical protein CIPAW_08G120600 [Carya illinoinensis]
MLCKLIYKGCPLQDSSVGDHGMQNAISQFNDQVLPSWVSRSYFL